MPKRSHGGPSTRSKGKEKVTEVAPMIDGRFVTIEGRERCLNSQKRKLVSERGIEFGEFEFAPMFVNNGWGQWAAPRANAIGSIVREFYANAMDCAKLTSIVRGKEVSYSMEVINRHYGLPAKPDTSALTEFNEEVEAEELLSMLAAHDGVNWEMAANGDILHMKEANLNREAKALNRFISASFLPTGHTSEVTMERCTYICAIMRGLAINIGHSICIKTIHGTGERRMAQSLFFPQLITELCLAAGVEVDASDELIVPKPSIRITDVFLQDNNAQPAALQPRPRAPRVPNPARATPDWAAMQSQLDSLRLAVNANTQSIAALQTSFQEQSTRNNASNDWMAGMMQQMAASQNIQYAPYPYPCQYPYPPPPPPHDHMDE